MLGRIIAYNSKKNDKRQVNKKNVGNLKCNIGIETPVWDTDMLYTSMY